MPTGPEEAEAGEGQEKKKAPLLPQAGCSAGAGRAVLLDRRRATRPGQHVRRAAVLTVELDRGLYLPATGRKEDPLARPGLTVTRMDACMQACSSCFTVATREMNRPKLHCVAIASLVG